MILGGALRSVCGVNQRTDIWGKRHSLSLPNSFLAIHWSLPSQIFQVFYFQKLSFFKTLLL